MPKQVTITMPSKGGAMHRFLQEDLNELDRQLEELGQRMRDICQQMGESCRQGAETSHDNFAFEEGTRLIRLWSERIRYLSDIRNQAVVVEPERTLRVGFGKTAMCVNETTGQIEIYKIGSYVHFLEVPGVTTISYDSPLAEFLLGAYFDEVREGLIGGKIRRYRIIIVY